MYRLREMMIRFMAGRYGSDNLNWLIFWLYLAMFVVYLITRAVVFYYIGFVLILLYIFRTLSRNIYRRQLENQKYLNSTKGIRVFCRRQKNRWRDRKTHVYRKCPGCKTFLRLPKKKGTHIVVCPKCRKEFEVKVR
ncbi:MAG: hypothetical protein ACOX7J_01275 [Bacillota bacterium]|jgi:hypothetical protein